MNFVEVTAPFLSAVSLYLFVATFKHICNEKQIKSLFFVKVLRIFSITILSSQSFTLMFITYFVKFSCVRNEFCLNSSSNRSYISEHNSTYKKKLDNKTSLYTYALINKFFVLLYRTLMNFMLVSRVRIIFKKAPFNSKSTEFKCNVCIFIGTVLSIIKFVAHIALVGIEKKLFFILMSLAFFGNSFCKLYFVHCSLMTFKLFNISNKKVFKRQRKCVKRMKICMLLYVINDVTLIIVLNALKAFNTVKYDDSFIIIFLFSNCIDFTIFLCTYTKWKHILTLYFVGKLETKQKQPKNSKGVASSNKKSIELKTVKLKTLPMQ